MLFHYMQCAIMGSRPSGAQRGGSRRADSCTPWGTRPVRSSSCERGRLGSAWSRRTGVSSASRELVSATLSGFRRLGLVRYRRQSAMVVYPEALARYLDLRGS